MGTIMMMMHTMADRPMEAMFCILCLSLLRNESLPLPPNVLIIISVHHVVAPRGTTPRPPSSPLAGDDYARGVGGVVHRL